MYSGYTNVYCYRNIPILIKDKLQLGNIDRGIDIIAMKNNIWFAVQCKWRSNRSKPILKGHVGEFIEEVSRTKIKHMILASNVTNITLYYQHRTDIKWMLYDYYQSRINSDVFIPSHVIIEKQQKCKIVLRNYQKDAIDTLANAESSSYSKQVIMACGTGKTVVMAEYYKRKYSGRRAVFVVPSLNLVSQIYSLMKRYAKNIMCICSSMDGKSLVDDNKDDYEARYQEYIATDMDTIYTTNTKIIKRRMREQDIVVISTYQSSKLLHGQPFYAAFYDEAHKTVNNDTFSYLLNNNIIFENIFFTATPRYYVGNSEKCYGMGNKNIYGNVVYEYPFGNAIEDKYILDFRVILYHAPPENF
jgi:predicted helicase